MDIIKVGLYLLSCLQKTIGLTVGASKQVVVTDEKGIFYGAVLTKSGILLYEKQTPLKRKSFGGVII